MKLLAKSLNDILPFHGVWACTPKAVNEADLYYDFALMVQPHLLNAANYERVTITELFTDYVKLRCKAFEGRKEYQEILGKASEVHFVSSFLLDSEMTITTLVMYFTPVQLCISPLSHPIVCGWRAKPSQFTGCGTSTLGHQQHKTSTGPVYLRPSLYPEEAQQGDTSEATSKRFRSS